MGKGQGVERLSTRQNIKGLKDHSDRETLLWKYIPASPGEHIARLDHHAWGRKGNLFLYFTELGTHCPFCVSVWWNKHYQAAQGGPAFDEEPAGGVFRLVVEETRNQTAKLVLAELVASVAEVQTVRGIMERIGLDGVCDLAYDIDWEQREPPPERDDLAAYEEWMETGEGAGAAVKGVFFWPSGAGSASSKTEPPESDSASSNTGDLK